MLHPSAVASAVYFADVVPMANCQVSSKLAVETPSKELVDAYLKEIAKGYGVPWSEPGSANSDGDDTGDGGVKVSSCSSCPIPRISSTPYTTTTQ